jgi:pimeloyl-ACP methyl ester carboxylesterase
MRRSVIHLLASLAVLLLLGPAVGCSGMKNGSLTRVAPTTDNQRVGSVYLLRGWIGIFSTGIDSLGKKLNESGIHAEVFQESQWSRLADEMIAKYKASNSHEPIVIIGHSYGADDAIAIARKLNEHDIAVDLVVTLDPVTPRKVPANIRLAYNLYQSNGALDSLPWLRGIPLTPDEPGPAKLKNMDIRVDRTDLLEPNLDHFNIEKKDKIHSDVIAQVMKVCEPRVAWNVRRDALAARDVAVRDVAVRDNSPRAPAPSNAGPQAEPHTATSLLSRPK